MKWQEQTIKPRTKKITGPGSARPEIEKHRPPGIREKIKQNINNSNNIKKTDLNYETDSEHWKTKKKKNRLLWHMCKGGHLKGSLQNRKKQIIHLIYIYEKINFINHNVIPLVRCNGAAWRW